MAKEPSKTPTKWDDDDDDKKLTEKDKDTKAAPKSAPTLIAPNEPYPTGAPYYPPTEGVAQNEAPPEPAAPPVTRSK